MKNKMLAALIVILLVIPFTLPAGAPQKKTIGSTVVWARQKNIMPLLEYIAENKGNYFTSIRGQYIDNYIGVTITSNVTVGNIDSAEIIVEKVVRDVLSFYLSVDGQVKLSSHENDIVWTSVEYHLKEGKISNKLKLPDKDKIYKAMRSLNEHSTIRFGLTEAKRKQLFYEQRAIVKNIRAKYSKERTNREDVATNILQLYKEEQNKLLIKYGINQMQLLDILDEGMLKKW